MEDRVWGMAYSWTYREGGCSRLDEVVFHVCDGHISTVNVIKSRITAMLVGLCAHMWGNIFITLRWEDPSTVGGTIPWTEILHIREEVG